MVLSSTEEIVYRFLGFAQATRPRTCSPFHQVRAYVRSSCSSSFLPSPTSPPLTFLIDCSSSPPLLPSSFHSSFPLPSNNERRKNSPCLLACLLPTRRPGIPTYSPFPSASCSLLISRISPAPTLSMLLLLLFVEERKERKKPLLACCQQEDLVTPTYSPFHQVRVVFVHANFVSIYLLDAPPPPPLSSEKRKEKKGPCLLAACQ